MNRERFNSVLASVNLSPSSRAYAGAAGAPEPIILRLNPEGWAPNNRRLPVLVYRGVVDLRGTDPVAELESRFERNGWPAQWRDGIYGFHHYHSTAHEALAVVRGRAQVVLGGDHGKLVRVTAGDILILPVGAVHCCPEHSADFLVIGAYPDGQHWDVCREAPTEKILARMEQLPVPASDPLIGKSGALHRLWRLPKNGAPVGK